MGENYFDDNEEVMLDDEFNEDVTDKVVEAEIEKAAKPKKERKPSPRKILTEEIFQLLRDNVDDLPEDIVAKVSEFDSLPKRGGRKGSQGPSVQGQLREMILERGTVHEDELWSELKLGRLEAKRKFYNMHKKEKDPEKRVWVSFDPETGNYTLVGTGPEVPEGF